MIAVKSKATHEEYRLLETKNGKVNWKKWSPYLSESGWATVHKDYSVSGDAWNYFPHEYFHGDNGASHQTGWTGLVAKLI